MGKTVLYLQNELPEAARYLKGFEEATSTLGWSFEAIVFNSEEPSKGMETALAKHPDFIATVGVPTAVMKPQMKAAHQAGIPVVSTSTTEKPSADGFAAQINGTLRNNAENLGAWIMQDSGGEADVLVITLPIFPVLSSVTEYFSKELPTICEGCSYDELDVTPADLANGSVPEKVVASIQSHPEINYVVPSFSDVSTGLPSVLKSAGYADKVKIAGIAAAPPQIQEVPDQMAAWTIPSDEYMAWAMVDAMARIATEGELPQGYEAMVYETPNWVVDSTAARESLKPYGYEWPGPGNGAYKEELKKLWGVTGG
jgi:ribose transport system substrate-binding protein